MATLPNNWEAVKTLFDAALDLDSSGRSVFLRDNCPDVTLRAEVERLLNEHDQAGAFLSTPALGSFPLEAEAPTQRFSGGQMLAGRFRVIRFIAGGGMGEVYEAEDEELHERVAVKIIRPEILAQPNAISRFKREVHLARKVTHPNVCRVFDLFRHRPDGGSRQEETVFISMELLHGKTLETRLRECGRMSMIEALPLVGQMASALGAAHAVGIVHRDFKPGNVVGGTTQPDWRSRCSNRFRTCSAIGGPRAGLSFHRPRPFGNSTLHVPRATRRPTCYPRVRHLRPRPRDLRDGYRGPAVPRRHPDGGCPEALSEIPTPPQKLERELSSAWASIILHCLERDPSRRFPSAESVAAALAGGSSSSPSAIAPRRHLASVVGAALAIAIAGGIVTKSSVVRGVFFHSSPASQIRSIAVLPLASLSREPDQEYFADGMTDELITKLSHIADLHVISRTSVMQYKGSVKTLPQIAKELQVDAVVEGSVQREGDHVRISAQLINASNDAHLWSGSYERDIRSILTIQEEVAQSVAGAIKVEITPQEKVKVSSAHSVNPEAYDLYLKSRFYWNKRTKEGISKSLEYSQSAIEKDPNYAMAYVALADSYLLLGAGQFAALTPKEAFPKAEAAAAKALQLDNSLGEAHATLGYIKNIYDWDWQGAQREFQQAIVLDPGYATAHQWYALLLVNLGKFDEALAQCRVSQTLDPLSPAIRADTGYLLYLSRRNDEAIKQLNETLEMYPTFLWLTSISAGPTAQRR